MPIVPFETLPDSARIWIFASDRPVHGAAADTLLAEVDRFLADWRAHGVPLRNARDWRDDRFLTIGVDVNEENASGCSIDGLFRTLQALQREIGAQLVGGGRVFYRTRNDIEAVTREQFAERVQRGEVTGDAAVFDPSLTDLGSWRAKFVQPAAKAWTARYFAPSP